MYISGVKRRTNQVSHINERVLTIAYELSALSPRREGALLQTQRTFFISLLIVLRL